MKYVIIVMLLSFPCVAKEKQYKIYPNATWTIGKAKLIEKIKENRYSEYPACLEMYCKAFSVDYYTGLDYYGRKATCRLWHEYKEDGLINAIKRLFSSKKDMRCLDGVIDGCDSRKGCQSLLDEADRWERLLSGKGGI